MTLKPWREVAVPHRDVLEGTFQQSEFAADITAVHDGKAPREYQDAVAFFERTFITEGMRQLLTHVAQRLSGKGGEPVLQLQTAFGGGKTHTMLAVYHLATRTVALGDLPGVPGVIDQVGLVDVPQARVAVLDGNAHSPGQAWRHGKQAIRTLWGELAWQLGGSEGFAMVAESDQSGTSPGKNVLQELLSRHAPCAILLDELVVYQRQLSEGQSLTGGTYESNLSFFQALTEATKLVPTAVVLASLPESTTQAGGPHGAQALRSLEAVFGRVQALWKPVATEEAFEIVRRRLFEPVRDTAARDAVCRAFADAYVAEGARLPGETQEARYRERLLQAYPIHPEVFDRLYEDWTTIEGFQRTRGVLKLMAKVLHRLWEDDNKDLMILPGSLPLSDGSTRNELTYYLSAGWDPVIERDIDGSRAETTELETKEPRFGQLQAARRVARTLFLGTAPASAATRPGIRGLDRARVLLGCLQPAQSAALYSDALNRLADRLHYLSSSGDRAQETTRFWFDTRANLRREMEDRKRRFDEKSDVRARLSKVLERTLSNAPLFDGLHVFTPHADVADDASLRLVVLSPDAWHSRDEGRPAAEAALEFVRNNGSKPRYRGNRLLFLAADHATCSRLSDAVRVALAWRSIVEDVRIGKLNIDLLQKSQAEKELQGAEDVLPRVARECYKWLLVPTQDSPTAPQIEIEAFVLNTGGGSFGSAIQTVCDENGLVVSTWSPVHLRAHLQDLYWKGDQVAVKAATFWEDSLRYLYLTRLRNRAVLGKAITAGASSCDFFGTAYGEKGDQFDGFHFGDGAVQFDDTLLLIEPATAARYAALQLAAIEGTVTPKSDGTSVTGEPSLSTPGSTGAAGSLAAAPVAAPPVARWFHGSADVPAATAKVRLVQLADEIVSLLSSDPKASVHVTLEISAEFPQGASPEIKRAVTENAKSLKLKAAEWE